MKRAAINLLFLTAALALIVMEVGLGCLASVQNARSNGSSDPSKEPRCS